MRSGELAKLTGVTPRTLRHYRAIGLLSEPSRSENGYCDYQLDDLVRLLRIKNLASLGFSLDTIREMLDTPDQTAGEQASERLEQLDRELVLRIEELERQRSVIALLQQQQLDVDTPVEVGSVISLLQRSGMSGDLLSEARQALILAGHALEEPNIKYMTQLYETLHDQGLMQQYIDYEHKMYQLTEDTTEEEQDQLVQEAVQLFGPLLTSFFKSLNLTEEEWNEPNTPFEDYVLAQEMGTLNAVQGKVVARFAQELTATLPELEKPLKRFPLFA